MFQPSFHLFKSMFQLGARAQARPYNKSLTLHRSVWRQVRLFLFYLSFIDIYICLHCILMLRSNVIGQACSREGRTTEDRGSNKRCKTCNNRCRWPANFFPTRPPRRLLGDSADVPSRKRPLLLAQPVLAPVWLFLLVSGLLAGGKGAGVHPYLVCYFFRFLYLVFISFRIIRLVLDRLFDVSNLAFHGALNLLRRCVGFFGDFVLFLRSRQRVETEWCTSI